jgi:hypothetical protein
VPRSVAAELTGWILSWARAPGRPPSEVMRLWPTEWLPAWFSRLGNVERFLLLAIPACAVILGVRCAVHGRARIRSSAGRWLDATLVAGVLFWFLVVPDPRFGVGFYAVLAAVLLARVARPVLPRVPSRAIAFALAALLAAEVVVFYARHPVPLAGLARRVTVPAGYPIVPALDAKGANFTISIPERGDRCWYDPFPCVPHAPGERVERRGDDWARGFRATENGRSPQDSW